MTSLLTHPQYQYFQLLSQSDWRDLARLTKQEQNTITATCNLFKLKREQGDFALSKQFEQACRALNRHIAINKGAEEGHFTERFSKAKQERAVKLANCISQCWQEHVKNIDWMQKGLVEVEGDLSNSHLILIGDTCHRNLMVQALISALVSRLASFERNTVLQEGLASGEKLDHQTLIYNDKYFPLHVECLGWDDMEHYDGQDAIMSYLQQKGKVKNTRLIFDGNSLSLASDFMRLTDRRTESLIKTISLNRPNSQHRVIAVAGDAHIIRSNRVGVSDYEIRDSLKAYKFAYVRVINTTFIEGTPFAKINPKQAFQNEYQKKIVSRRVAIALTIIQALGMILTSSILITASFSIAVLSLASLFLIGTVGAAVWASRACPWSKQ